MGRGDAVFYFAAPREGGLGFIRWFFFRLTGLVLSVLPGRFYLPPKRAVTQALCFLFKTGMWVDVLYLAHGSWDGDIVGSWRVDQVFSSSPGWDTIPCPSAGVLPPS